MKKIYTICCLCYGLLFASCNSWLDLKPYGEVEADKMFEDEKGFIQTLTGTYLQLTSTSAYGYELTAGFVEQIVHNWKKQNEFYMFDYSNAEVAGQLDATWAAMYKAIANTNLLLQHLEGKNPADFDYYNLIKGEALGLRAYLHLDLLRLFGPVVKDDRGNSGMDKKAIPYRTEFNNQVVKQMTASEVLGYVQRDLDSAYVLLKEDPIHEYGRDEAKDLYRGDEEVTAPQVGMSLSFRGCRMNYYAVCATLARLHLLKEDYTNALKYAKEVIDSELFEFVKYDDVAYDDEYMFERELIWSLYDSQTSEHLDLRSNEKALDGDYIDYVYTGEQAYGSEEDYRYSYWFDYFKGSPSFWYMLKYERVMSEDHTTDETPWRTVVPMIRLGEMYCIAAEASLETDPAEAYRLLNVMRESRNLPELPSNLENNASALREQMIYECQKDSWGEGKLFYLYKRLYRPIKTREENIAPTHEIFELPVPKDEIEYGDNNN